MNYKAKFATRMADLKPSAIREILKVLANPEIISMAGGMPDPDTLPMQLVKQLSQEVIDRDDRKIFQYGTTEGYPSYREAIANYLNKTRNLDLSAQQVFTSTGAQGTVNALAMLLLNKGDRVAIESPTFLASIKTFRAYEPEFVQIPSDENGIMTDKLEEAAKQGELKFVYLIPNFQNPTGFTMSLERRQEVARIAKQYDLIILEDDPYYELRYEGEHLPTVYSLAPDHTIYTGSLSKVLSPGMRLAYYIGPEAVTAQMVSLKQGVDVHTSNLDQAIAAAYINNGHLDKHLPFILDTYRPKLKAMLQALEQHIPSGFKFSHPEGGMFIWVEGPKEFDATALYQTAIEHKIAYVPGQFFFLDEENHKNTLRLNFTNIAREKIDPAIRQLCSILN